MPELRIAGWLWLAAAVVAADQASKFAASSLLEYARPVTLLPWFDFTLHHNRGAAFSFLSDAGGWQRWFFAVLALVRSVVGTGQG